MRERLNTVSMVGLPVPDSSCDSVALPFFERRDSSHSDSPARFSPVSDQRTA